MTNSALKVYIPLLITLFIPFIEVHGQETDTLIYELDYQIGAQRKTGVFSQRALNISANHHLEKGQWGLANFSNYTYTQVNGGVIADDWDFRSIITYRPSKQIRVLPAIAHNFHSNVLYRIRNSNRGILGLRFFPVKKAPDFSVLLGGGYERSLYRGALFSNSDRLSNQRSFALGFLNIAVKHRFGKSKVALSNNLSVVQSFEEQEDIFIWWTTGLSIPVGKVLSLGIKYDLRYRNVHLVNLPKVNDLLLLNATLSFGS